MVRRHSRLFFSPSNNFGLGGGLRGAHTDGIAATERQQDRLHGIGYREEMFRSGIRLFEIHGLGPAAVGEMTGEFEITKETGHGHDEANRPVN